MSSLGKFRQLPRDLNTRPRPEHQPRSQVERAKGNEKGLCESVHGVCSQQPDATGPAACPGTRVEHSHGDHGRRAPGSKRERQREQKARQHFRLPHTPGHPELWPLDRRKGGWEAGRAAPASCLSSFSVAPRWCKHRISNKRISAGRSLEVNTHGCLWSA